MVERSGERCYCAELHRLRGVFLTALGAEETEIEASFREAIELQMSKRRVHWRHARKQPTQNTAVKTKSERVKRTWIPTISLVTPNIPSTHLLITARHFCHGHLIANYPVPPVALPENKLGTISARRLDNSSVKLCHRARSGGYLLLGMVVGDSVTAGAWTTIEICIRSFQVSPSRTTIAVQ